MKVLMRMAKTNKKQNSCEVNNGGDGIVCAPLPAPHPDKGGRGNSEKESRRVRLLLYFSLQKYLSTFVFLFVGTNVVVELRLGGGQFYSPLFLLRTHTQAAGVSREMKVFLFSISYLFYTFIFVLAFLCVSFSAVGFLIDFYVNV